MPDSSWRYGRSCFAPSAQLRPTLSGRAWRTLSQNASTVWPDSVRPDASVMVPLIDHRHPEAQLVEQRLDGEDGGLGVEGVEDGLDEQDVRAALDQAATGVRVRPHELVPGDVPGARVVDVR